MRMNSDSEAKNGAMMKWTVTWWFFLALVCLGAPLLSAMEVERLHALDSEALLGHLHSVRAEMAEKPDRAATEDRLTSANDLFRRLQVAVQREYAAGELTAEDAAVRLVGGFGELATLLEDDGHFAAAAQIYWGALRLVEGTLQEIEMLKGIARCAEWSEDHDTARMAYEAVAEHPLFLEVEDGLLPAHEYVVWRLVDATSGGASGRAEAARVAVTKLVERLRKSSDPELLAAAHDRLDALSWEERPWLEPLTVDLADRRSELLRAEGRPDGLQGISAPSETLPDASADLESGLAANFQALVAGGGD